MRRWTGLLPLLIALTGCAETVPLEELALNRAEAATTDWPIEPQADDWPWWRGKNQDATAIASTTGPPLTWSATENVIWKTPFTGRAHASPVVWGDKVFLAGADDEANQQSLMALRRDDGKPLWNVVIHRDELPHRHEKNSHASATPACDGRQVYVSFLTSDGLWVSAVNFEGDIVWQTKAGPFDIQHGYGASPVLFESLVIVAGDHQGPGYLTALDRRTGKLVWRTPRTEHPSYGTPIIREIGDSYQLLLSGGYLTAGYNPQTGQQIWQCEGPTQVMGNTMAVSDDLVFSSGGYPDKEILAIRADASSGLAGEIVWRTKEGVAYVPSPLAADGRLYVVADNGVVTCFAAATGKVLWKQRLGGKFTASPVLAADKIYIADEDGTTHVIAPGDEFKSLAKNSLDEEQYATPTITGGRIYLRTTDHLYCLGESDRR